MPTATRDGNILKIGDTIRIEAGPVRVTAEATKELLSNEVTAAHYVLPTTATKAEIEDPGVLTVDGMKTAFDADGKPIVLGQEMTYLDWNGHRAENDGSTGFYVYVLDSLTAAEKKERGITDEALAKLPSDDVRREATEIWREIGCEPDEAAAISLATDYLVKQAGA